MKLEAHLYRWQHTRKTKIAPSTNVQSRDNPSVMMMKLKESTQMMQSILLKQNQAKKISSIPRPTVVSARSPAAMKSATRPTKNKCE
jgi:hypothetical protein